MTPDKPPPPHVRKTPSGLMPVSRYAADVLESAAMGSLFKLAPTKGRSHPQLGWYWIAMKTLAEATGEWPTAEHVHRDVKRALGYVSRRVDPFTGDEIEELDSTAFDKMTHQQFTEYLKKVKLLFLEQMGIDIVEMMG